MNESAEAEDEDNDIYFFFKWSANVGRISTKYQRSVITLWVG